MRFGDSFPSEKKEGSHPVATNWGIWQKSRLPYNIDKMPENKRIGLARTFPTVVLPAEAIPV
jgi:hypothetical protein